MYYWDPNQSNWARKKEIEGIQVKKEVKLSLLADDIIMHEENPKHCRKKILLKLINKLNTIAEYKTNIQKLICISIY